MHVAWVGPYLSVNFNFVKMAEKLDRSERENDEKELEYHIAKGISSDLMICNVELTNSSLGMGSFGTVVEASWYGATCAAKQVHAKLSECSRSKGMFDFFEIPHVQHSRVKLGNLEHVGIFCYEDAAQPCILATAECPVYRDITDQTLYL